MKKVYWIFGVALFLFICGYLFIRYSVLKTKAIRPDNTKARSVIDLRPAIIAKLRELVKDGSNGLYDLSIDRIEPSVLQSTVDLYKVKLVADTAGLNKLHTLQLLPDDIFKISFDSLHMDGIGINDLLQKDRIDIASVFVTRPVIELFHKKRPYNELKRKEDSRETLYQRLMKNMKQIAIGKIVIRKGTFINYNLSEKNKKTRFNDVSVDINHMLIDSSTQYDKSRFLFAKSALITTAGYTFPTPDSLYYLKAGNISISGEQHKFTATNVHLQPRGNRQQFIKKLSYQKERYDLFIPKLVLNNVDWYDVVNGEKIFAGEMNIYNADLDVYFDRSLPPRPDFDMRNFPDQLIMKLPFPVSVSKINIQDLDLVYTEFNPLVSKTGTVYFDNIQCIIHNVTNTTAGIKDNRFTTISGQALFMHKVPTKASIRFDLAKYKSGIFTADIQMQNLDSMTINPVAAPLGEFSVKSGFMKTGSGHVLGDNFNAQVKGIIMYNDLKLTPLKKDAEKPGRLKKKMITGFIANTFLIKNDNPSNRDSIRVAEVSHKRKANTSFFSFIWKSILTAILKTIGLPLKIADQ